MGGGVPRWGPRTTVLLVSITDVNLNIKYTQYSRLNMILLCIHQHICVEPEGVSFYTHVSIIGFTAMYYVTVLCQKIIYSPKLNIYAPSKTSQTAGYYKLPFWRHCGACLVICHATQWGWHVATHVSDPDKKHIVPPMCITYPKYSCCCPHIPISLKYFPIYSDICKYL